MQEADQFGSGGREERADLGEEAGDIYCDVAPHTIGFDE
jgi:hypothetical protein